MFSDFHLNPVLLRNVTDQGYKTPTPIQSKAIPPAMTGRDLIATAETGSGKTAAFLLPLLQRLMSTPRGGVRGLILCPTREIALQTQDHAKRLGRNTGVKSVVIYGGVGFEPQITGLRSGADLVVATPGRLLDHLGRGNLQLDRVNTLVLDEADRMLDMGFLPDLKRILAHVPAARQTLLYSATMPPEILSLSQQFMKDPAHVAVGQLAAPPKTISQGIYLVPNEEKTPLLLHLVADERLESVLVFTRTKHRADRVARQLAREGVSATCIHGNRSQNQREAALQGFRDGTFRVLVATDIAARGLDIQGVTHVINYDLPNVPDDYVHRIGRTARAGAEGDALSFVAPEEMAQLRDIEKALGQRLRRMSGEAHEEVAACQPRPEAQAKARSASPPAGNVAASTPPREGGRPRRRRRRSRGKAQKAIAAAVSPNSTPLSPSRFSTSRT
ncbi:MAG: DEAD/DEAH box helicase [Methanocella sp.]